MAINRLQTKEAEENVIPVYEVTFDWGADVYGDRSVGIKSIHMIVEAPSCFKALDVAWQLIESLNLVEPKKFNATRKDKCR